MQIGEVIRKYRREKNMTQEEMAKYLGVTAPAVNKWENGNSMPDIMLLAPIARLLDITPDILLSFREELSQEEIGRMIEEANARLQDCCKRALESKKESLRYRGADALFHFYMRQERYEEAEEYLNFFSEQNPERKRKQAFLYSKTGRPQEAYKVYEEILFSGYGMAAQVFYGLFGLSMQEKDMERADMFLVKLKGLAELFEMGTYQANAGRLEFAVMQKDEERTLEIMGKLLEGVEELTAFAKSPLYAHMSFSEPREEFTAKVKQDLLESFRDEETYGFLKENKRYQNLIKRM